MPTPNKLLAALPSNIGAELKPDLQHIQLTFKRVLQEPRAAHLADLLPA
jgi:hypothetical protein